MKSRLFIMLAGVVAGVFMGLSDHAGAQEIGGETGTISMAPTISSNPPATNSNTQNAAPSPRFTPPSPIAPTSALFAPYVAAGGYSQTGESLAETLQQENSNQPYNLLVGPVKLRAEGDMTVAVNDNIGLSKDNRQTDFLFTPMAILHGRWDISSMNALTFNIGVGYQAYLLHSQYDCVILAPDSQANFRFFVGDVAITLYDSFSYEQDPTQVGQLSNQVRLRRFMNDAGIDAKWDLDQFTVELGYDHSNLWVMDSIYDYLTDQTDSISPTLTYKITKTLDAGLNATFADTRYEKSFENDNTSESVGPFVSATFSNELSLTAGAGLFLTQYDHGGGNGDNSDLSSYYANLAINHQLTEFLTESLTAGKEYLPGLTSNYTSRIYVTYGDRWSATKEIGVGANLFWENLSDSDATTREDSDRYGVSLSLADALTDHLNLNVGYQFILKDADPSNQSYYQNLGTLEMNYNF